MIPRRLRVLMAVVPVAFAAGLAEAADKAGAARVAPVPKVLQEARAAVEALFAAFESGDVRGVESRLDSTIPGLAVLLEAMRAAAPRQRWASLHATGMRVSGEGDLALVEVAWERQIASVDRAEARVGSGQGVFFLREQGGFWRVIAIAGDNPLSVARGSPARLQLTPHVIYAQPGGCDPEACPRGRLELFDADLAAAESVAVEVETSQGDRETFTLNAAAPGRFLRADIGFSIRAPNSAAPGSGVLEIDATPGALPARVSARHLDEASGGDRGAALVVQVLQVRQR